jgi:hypothetical protein
LVGGVATAEAVALIAVFLAAGFFGAAFLATVLVALAVVVVVLLAVGLLVVGVFLVVFLAVALVGEVDLVFAAMGTSWRPSARLSKRLRLDVSKGVRSGDQPGMG